MDSVNIRLSETVVADAIDKEKYSMDSVYTQCKAIVAASLDNCHLHSWVFYTSTVTVNICSSCLLQILTTMSPESNADRPYYADSYK